MTFIFGIAIIPGYEPCVPFVTYIFDAVCILYSVMIITM